MYNLLSGLSVIEVSSFVASPTAGLYCAQMGAEVIRVDHTAGGLDYDRFMLTKEGRSLSWENLNRAKKSVALDLQSAEGRELAVELARATGQLITNLPVGSFLSHAAVAAGRPDLVSVRIMGWHDGRQAMDFTVNAASGYPLMTGPEDWDPALAPPVNQVLPAWDFITGAYCAFSLLAGLRHRDATGGGSELRVPLGDVAIGTMANAGAMAEMLYRGGDRERLGNAIWGAFGRDFTSRDGQRFMIAALTAKQWNATVAAFGLADGVAALEQQLGTSFKTSDANRFARRAALFALFQAAAERLDYADLAARLTTAGATFERYRTMFEAANDPALVGDNPLFGPSPANPSGFDYPAPRSLANIPQQEAGDPRAAPYLGEHSEEVLAERLGLSSGEIAKLIDRGVVATSDKDFEMTQLRRAAIVAPIRTPVGKFGGSLAPLTAGQLGAVILKALMDRTKIDPARVDDVVFSQGYGNGEAPCIGHWSWLLAGLPQEVPGYQLDRRCGSGLQAIVNAAMMVQTGHSDVVVAGGCESMSNVEHYSTDIRKGMRAGNLTLHDRLTRGRVMSQPVERYGVISGMIETAENLAKDWNISREACDAYAARSHQRAAAAWAAGKFDDELVPVAIPQKKGDPLIFAHDEGYRADATPELLGQLRPLEGGVVTAGNASQQNDAAAACLVVAEDKLEELGLEPIAWFHSWAAAGCDPSRMGYGPVPATERLFARNGLSFSDIGLIELNEAFAPQVLACLKGWGWSDDDSRHDLLNVNGSGISLGHPIGATGGRILANLTRELQRRDVRYGLETMCIGGGQGIAAVFEKA